MLSLIRLEMAHDCTIGALLINGQAFCWAIEPPWLQNAEGKSCIPPGAYPFAYRQDWRRAEKYGPTIEIGPVPDRDGILVHPGNWASESQGCIMPGLAVTTQHGRRMVTKSEDAFRALMRELGPVPSGQLVITCLCTADFRWSK